MWHGEGEVLDVMPYPRKCLEPGGSSESAWCKGQAGSGEERWSRKLTTL